MHLTARHEPTLETKERLDQLAGRYQANIHTHTIDVGNSSAVQAFMDGLYQNSLQLAGIFHLAGVLR